MDDAEVASRLKGWCEENGVPTHGVLVMTIQENRSTEFASVVVHMDEQKVLPNFPADGLSSYTEVRQGSLLVCYKAGLSLPPSFGADAPSLGSIGSAGGPFGCNPSEVLPYKHRPTAHDRAFRDFVQGSGHHPNLIFEVKTQVDNGPLLSTKYYTLANGTRTEVEATFTQKVHAYKNYRCPSKNLFFAVDLYRADESTGRNYHHMRLNPFTKMNTRLLQALYSSGTSVRK